MDDPHSTQVKELETLVSRLKEDNERVKNELEDAKGEINRLNTTNENLNLQMKA